MCQALSFFTYIISTGAHFNNSLWCCPIIYLASINLYRIWGSIWTQFWLQSTQTQPMYSTPECSPLPLLQSSLQWNTAFLWTTEWFKSDASRHEPESLRGLPEYAGMSPGLHPVRTPQGQVLAQPEVLGAALLARSRLSCREGWGPSVSPAAGRAHRLWTGHKVNASWKHLAGCRHGIKRKKASCFLLPGTSKVTLSAVNTLPSCLLLLVQFLPISDVNDSCSSVIFSLMPGEPSKLVF